MATGATGNGEEAAGGGAGRRPLELGRARRRAIEALHRQRTMQAKDRLAAGPAYEDHDLVFSTSRGRGLLETNVSRSFRRLRDCLELPLHPLYGLRHAAASMQIAAGVPIEIISKRLGHRNISVTMDIYGHLLPEANREAARRVDEFLAGVPKVVHRKRSPE